MGCREEDTDTWEEDDTDIWEEAISIGRRMHSITRIRNGVKEDSVKCLSGRTMVMSIYHRFSLIKVAKSAMELVQ